jgi:pilus assembly protein CpaB
VDGRRATAEIVLGSGAMNPVRPVLLTLHRLHRRLLLHRRPLAALTAAGAVLAALQATSPAPPDTVAVWTARHDLPGGTVVRPADLASTRLPRGVVPDDVVTDAGEVLGRTLAAPMARGEVLTSLRTVAAGLLRGYPGTTAVPLRITDAAVVDLLRVGDRVSLVVADPDGRGSSRVLVDDVPLVAVPRPREGPLAGSTPGRLVVAAVPTERAGEVAATAATSILIPMWSR